MLHVILPAILLTLTVSCSSSSTGGSVQGNTATESVYRTRMRSLVQAISTAARATHPGFIVIPQNGHTLLTIGGRVTDEPAQAYLGAIDGVGREDLFYGYDGDGEATPTEVADDMLGFLDLAERAGVQVLVTDYCDGATKVDDSYGRSESHGFISTAADHRDLDDIPPYPSAPFGVNAADVARLSDARNFLYLLNPSAFSSRSAFLGALAKTNYDAIIMDAFGDDRTPYTAAELDPLRRKANGGKRLLIAYMSIGEAEDYRHYWRPEWKTTPPSFLEAENPSWPGNYKVRFWEPSWQAIIVDGPDAYLGRIVAAGFDGVYLDIIDAYEYFESK